MTYYGSTSSIGMQMLESVDQIIISQKKHIYSYLQNKYVVTTDCGELLFTIKEDSSEMHSLMGGRDRDFTMDVFDAQNKKIMRLRRPYKWFGGSKLEVTLGGRVITIIRQIPTTFDKVLTVNDAANQPMLRLKRSWNATEFQLQAPTKQAIGCITKQWGGLLRVMFSSSDDFLITFPLDLEVSYKAGLIGACILINVLYYEEP